MSTAPTAARVISRLMLNSRLMRSVFTPLRAMGYRASASATTYSPSRRTGGMIASSESASVSRIIVPPASASRVSRRPRR